MRIRVLKFGGTSLASREGRQAALAHVMRHLAERVRVVVVVSAMGRSGDPYATDTLLEWLEHEGSSPAERERDLLLSCGEIVSAVTFAGLAEAEGHAAEVFTGALAGMMTDSQFGKAAIREVRPQRILHALEQNKLVIVCGFQGVDVEGRVTTLGRGGSDTTAAALGVALQAEEIVIYTDVNGILTADPAIVKDAHLLAEVTYLEMSHFANLGAKVVHPRAVEIAAQGRVPIRVCSTFSQHPGTRVVMEKTKVHVPIADRPVTGIATVSGLVQLRMAIESSEFDQQLRIFQSLARARVNVDFVYVSLALVSCTVFEQDLPRALQALRAIGIEPQVTKPCAKLSVIGGGMNGVPGIIAKVVAALTAYDIPILQTADSNASIWLLVAEQDLRRAANALHKAFQLHVPMPSETA